MTGKEAKKLEEAIDVLMIRYEEALNHKMKNPMSWALQKTWFQFDVEEKATNGKIIKIEKGVEDK